MVKVFDKVSEIDKLGPENFPILKVITSIGRAKVLVRRGRKYLNIDMDYLKSDRDFIYVQFIYLPHHDHASRVTSGWIVDVVDKAKFFNKKLVIHYPCL